MRIPLLFLGSRLLPSPTRDVWRRGQMCLSSAPNTDFPFRVRLRNATIDDLSLVRGWEEKEHMIESMSDSDIEGDDWQWEVELNKHPSWRFQLVAETTLGVPIGFVQIIDPVEEESKYWWQFWDNHKECEANLRAIDIWIEEEEYLNQGYGTEMMEQAISNYCFCNPLVCSVLVDPLERNKAAHRFYQRLGFRPLKIQHFGSDRCLVHRLERSEWQNRKERE